MILLVQVPTCVKQIFCYIRLANIFLNYLQDKISLPGQSNRFPMRKHTMSKHKNFLGENQNNLTVTSVHPSQVAHNSSFTKYFQHRVSRLKSAAEPCELPGNHQNNLFSFPTETSQCGFPPFQLKSMQRFWTSLQLTHTQHCCFPSKRYLKDTGEPKGDHPWLKSGGCHPDCCLPPHQGGSLRCQNVFSDPQKLML